MRKVILLLSILICTFCSVLNAQYTAINITSGYNADVVADGIGAPNTTTNNDVDGVNYCFVAPDYQYDATCALPTLSMPAGGIINSITTSGLTFQMAPYSANHDLRLTGTDSGVLTFASGISAQTVYLLATSGSGASIINVSVHFTDGTFQLFSGVNINDWFTSSTNVTINGMGRISNTVTACGGVSTGTTTPILFELSLQLNSVNYLKTINSVTVTKVSGGTPNIFGVSTLAPPTACTGKPAPGNTIASSTTICPSVNFTLTLQNPLTNAGGISYQWQSSPDSSTWTDIAGATSASYTTNITTKTYYHCVVKCTLSSLQSTSSNISVTTNPPALCICGPNNGTVLHGGTSPNISAVSVPGTNLSITSTATPTNGYISYTSPVPDLIQGQTYNLVTAFSGSVIASVWFDWNNNGLLEASEWTQIITSGTSGNTSFTVDPAAALGLSIMRVRARATGNINGAVDACTEFFSGQTMDFVINVIAGNPCSGTPTPGTVVPSTNKICPNTPFNLTDTGATFGVTGLTFQWQISTDGGVNWADIAGADSVNHYETAGITVATCYRRGISCGGGALVYSAPACVELNPTYVCYCGPNTGITLHTGTLPSLDSVSIAGTTLNLATPGVGTNGYTLHLNPVPTLSQGVTYTLYTQYSGASIASAWIDWNHDGLFDPTEWYQLTNNGSNSSITFTVPTTASVDSTVLRIRTNATFYANGSGNACTSFFSGETEDFLVYVNQGTVCSGAPVPGTTVKTSPSILCANAGFNLAVNGATANQVGLTYQWQSSTDNITWSDISGETNATYSNTSGITDSMYYHRVIFCSGFQSTSTNLIVKLSGAINNYPFVESFESLTTVGSGILPNCWTTVGTTKFTSAAAVLRNKIGARTGTHYVWSRYSASTYLISPTVNLTAGTAYTFSYYYRPSDPIAGFNINAFVANASDTTSLSANQLGTTIADPVDTSTWTLATYTYTPTSSGSYYFAIQSKCASYSPWYLLFDDINISNTPLPVTMLTFTGNKEANKNILNWSTTNEINNKGFEIQRSKDGNTFEKIGFVDTKFVNGTSTGTLLYTFDDLQPLDGNLYYRLKQIDINGKESYSKVILIKGGKGNKIEFTSIYPNPAKEVLKLGIYSPASQHLQIVFTDISGRIVKQLNVLANTGDNQLNLNVDLLNPGTYLIKASCRNGCEAAVQKFLKQ